MVIPVTMNLLNTNKINAGSRYGVDKCQEIAPNLNEAIGIEKLLYLCYQTVYLGT